MPQVLEGSPSWPQLPPLENRSVEKHLYGGLNLETGAFITRCAQQQVR